MMNDLTCANYDPIKIISSMFDSAKGKPGIYSICSPRNIPPFRFCYDAILKLVVWSSNVKCILWRNIASAIIYQSPFKTTYDPTEIIGLMLGASIGIPAGKTDTTV